MVPDCNHRTKSLVLAFAEYEEVPRWDGGTDHEEQRPSPSHKLWPTIHECSHPVVPACDRNMKSLVSILTIVPWTLKATTCKRLMLLSMILMRFSKKYKVDYLKDVCLLGTQIC